MIREYEAAGFFPSGTGRAPLDEQIPAPKDGEIVVFRDFSSVDSGFLVTRFCPRFWMPFQ
jgi:hypothetical protein